MRALRLLAGGGRDRVGHVSRDADPEATGSQRPQRAQPVLLARHEVEHDIDVRDDLLEGPGRVVDRLVDSEIPQEAVLLLAGSPDDVGAARLRDLNGQVPDAAGRRVHQNAGALPHLGHVDQRLPCRQPGKRQASRLLVAESVRGSRELAGGRGDELRIGPREPGEPGHAEDAIARGETGDVRVNLLHHSGDVPAEDQRWVSDRVPEPASRARLPVDGIDAGRGDADEHLGRRGSGRSTS